MPDDEPTTLRDLVDALGGELVDLLDAPSGDTVPISSVALADDTDLAGEIASPSAAADLYLLVGVPDAMVIRWLDGLGRSPADRRPAALMAKNAVADPVGRAARHAGVALVSVHPRARWEQVLPMVQRVLEHTRRTDAEPDLLAADTDLFDLARVVAQNCRGLVTVEDERSRVLAYSASDETADELRTLSILGREGPADYLRLLREWGVFDRLRRTGEVIDVPAHPEWGIRRRLVVGIREPADPADRRAPAPLLGSIWVQQGDRPFADDAADVLRGAAAVAARTITRRRTAPSTESLLIQRLFGAQGGGVDVPSLAAALTLPTGGPAAVIGFAVSGTAATADLTAVAPLIRLHAGSFRPDSVTALIGPRAYVLFPRFSSVEVVGAWTRQLVDQFETGRAIVLRAAIAAPVPDLGQVAAARVEVDRVLDGTAATFPRGRVTSLAESLTAVLLGEIVDLIGRHPELADPRVQDLLAYDRDHSAHLTDSVAAFLARHGDVRAAAAELTVHPNTLRYRLRRAERVLGIDLANPSDRLLLELQLALPRAGEPRATTA